MGSEKIDKLKDLHLETDLARVAKIVVPDADDWKPHADRLRDLIGPYCGGGPVVATDEGPSIEGLKDGHWVLLGSAMNNPAIMALYRRNYAFVDDFYPGGNGYALRTIHNPENQGHNVLMVGGSCPEGAASGLDQLERMLGSGSPLGQINIARAAACETGQQVHMTVSVKPVDPQLRIPEMGLVEYREDMAAGFDRNEGRRVVSRGIEHGLTHHLTNDAKCARMFLEALFTYEDLVRNVHGGVWPFDHMIFVYSWVWRLAFVWDLVEESEAFTDEERLRMTNILLDLARYVQGLRYFEGDDARKMEIRQNHWTYAALSMRNIGEYFRRYYGMDDFDRELDLARAIFDGQAESYKSNDDAGGGGYCWAVPSHQMTFDFARDDFRFAENGSLRTLADYAIQITDNMGSPCSFGDVGHYAERGPVSFRMFQGLSTAAWYYGDGAYTWALDWMGSPQPHLECFYKKVPHAIPDRLIGLSVAPFTKGLYQWVVDHGPGGASVPESEAFDKLVFREGFDPEDLYMLVDGISTFAHGHQDGNSIVRLTWKNRMWLAEADYIWKHPRHHSTVMLICDGESQEIPSLAGMKWAEDFGDRAFTRTHVSDYNGTDWERDILWMKGSCLIVVDTVALKREADYDVRCLWRTLGGVELNDEGLRVQQEGVFFRICNADDSVKTLETEHSRIADQPAYGAYPHADDPIRILKQRKELHGKPGEVVRYFNLMVAGEASDVDLWRIQRISEDAVRVTAPDGPFVFGAPDGETELGSLRIRAQAYALTDRSAILLEGTEISAGGVSVTSDVPIHLMALPGEGRCEIRAVRAAEVALKGLSDVRVNGGPAAASDGSVRLDLSRGTHEVTFAALGTGPLQVAMRTDDGRPGKLEPKANRLDSVDDSVLSTYWEADLVDSIRCIDTSGGETAIGAVGGAVVRFGEDGAITYRHETGAAVRAVHLAQVDGSGERVLLAGGDDCAVTMLDGKGEVRWRREFIRSHYRDSHVNAVTTADLTGDGETEVLVATDGWLVWALTAEGEEVWHRQIRHHAARSLVVDDVEGDGKLEVLVGTEYHSSNMLEADGEIRWSVGGGPSFTALAIADLNGDGVKEAFYGAMDGNVHAIDAASGEVLWRANLGDDVRFGQVLETEAGRCFLAGSDSGNVALVSGEGEKVWRRDLGEAVTGIAVLHGTDGGEDTIAAGTVDGRIVLISASGDVLGMQQTDSGITAMASADLGDQSGLIIGMDNGTLRALALK